MKEPMDEPEDLFEYVNLDNSAFAWRTIGQQRATGDSITRVDIALTSQTWQQMPWKHLLVLFIPTAAAGQDVALLNVCADGPCSDAQDALGRKYARESGMVCAFLFDVPNQPLFDGLTEDGLIAYSLIQHLDTQEKFWPLLLPMTRSATAAMTAVTQYSESIYGSSLAPATFVVTGASKRGWTSWLTAAVDSRVVGIAPVVYDNLNLFAQMPHQMAVFDTYSEQISDYSESGLMDRMVTPAGFQLARIIDPYTYRERIHVPKLIINGANDPYWATDAINLYWDNLVGTKSVLYAPNQQHSIHDPGRLDSTLIEFLLRISSGRILPQVSQTYDESGGVIEVASTVDVGSNDAPIAACLWIASSLTLDFRLSTWSEQEMPRVSATRFTSSIERRKGRNLAVFGEVRFKGRSGTFTVSTPIKVLSGGS